MDIITVLLLAGIVILLINVKTSFNEKFIDVDFRLRELQNLLNKKEQSVNQSAKPNETDPALVAKPIALRDRPVSTLDVAVERHKEVIADNMAGIRRPVKAIEPPKKVDIEPQPSFFERYPDLEKFIGENLVNKIGIAILVLAIAFFVKYAIDNNWVGAAGRVGIGIFCGGVLIAFAHRMRNSYKAFSSVLVGGGLAIFYFTITLAFQEFHLFSQTVSFIILIIITIFAVILALLYDKQELAVIALIGGFASPFMVSNGNANYNGLFICLLILNAGLLIIAYFKAWRVLNISSFVLSVTVFATILFTLSTLTYAIGFRFASIFYLLFFTINIINTIRESKKFLAIDFTILLTNTALFFAAGLFLLTAMHLEEYRGLFSAALGVINLVLSYFLFKNRKVDPNILFLLIGITLTFISLTAPIQLHGNNITLFWASESVLLYWLYQKSAIKLMQLTSQTVWVLMLLSLVIDIFHIYGAGSSSLTIIANKGFITIGFSAISSYLLYILIKKDASPVLYGIRLSPNLYRIIAFVLLFSSGFFEINYQFSYYYPNTNLNLLYIMLYIPFFVYTFYIMSNKINAGQLDWRVSLVLLVSVVFIYLVFTQAFFDILRDIVEHKKIPSSHFVAHWISAIVIAFIVYSIISLCIEHLQQELNWIAWVLTATIVLFLSLEVCEGSIIIFYSRTNSVEIIQTVYIKTGLPILWGLASFALMWLGMRNKNRSLRVISLSLFLLTLIKLFLFDINNIPVAGKIAAFFCLGILLLIISFMYQKVKKVIIEDEVKPKE